MDRQRTQRLGYLKDKAKASNLDEGEFEDVMDWEEDEERDEDKRKSVTGKVRVTSSDRVPLRQCQVDRCNANLTEAKQYYRRHRVCEFHAKASSPTVGGIKQRFCQQCSRFHELPEFDEAKRSCRRRLAGHNERRRKSSGDIFGESSGRKGFSIPTQEKNRVDMKLPMTSSSFKRPQIR